MSAASTKLFSFHAAQARNAHLLQQQLALVWLRAKLEHAYKCVTSTVGQCAAAHPKDQEVRPGVPHCLGQLPDTCVMNMMVPDLLSPLCPLHLHKVKNMLLSV